MEFCRLRSVPGGYDMNPANAYRMVKSTASDLVDDNALTLGAALAFYSALSLAPWGIRYTWDGCCTS